jgi:invasion protein IalB
MNVKRFAMGGVAWRFGVLMLLFPVPLAMAATGTVRMAQVPPAPKAPPQRGPAAAPANPLAPKTDPTSPPPGQPQAMTRTEIQYFENWTVSCNEFAEGPRTRVCSALLQVVQQETNQRVFTWSVSVDNNKQMVTVLQTPTGVAITPGVELQIGKTSGHKVPFTACDTGGCLATLPMDAALVREMTTSTTAQAVIQSSQGKTVQFDIQMKGFDKALVILSRS